MSGRSLRPSTTSTIVDLVEAIWHEHEQAGAAFRTAVEHAVRCGQLLHEAKAQVRHGEWGSWLEENFPASRRTAQGYMRLASHAEDAQAVAHLGVAGALKQLASTSSSHGADHTDEWVIRQVQHEDVEAELREVFVRGGWRTPGTIAPPDKVGDAQIAWAVLGVTLYQLDKAGAPADFGYADLDEYVTERLPDVENAWLGLEFEMYVTRSR